MFCKCGYWFSTGVTQVMACPHCAAETLVRSKEDQGRYSWSLLHSVQDPNPEWYAEWLKSVPAFNCRCREAWRLITAEKPPQFDSPAVFHKWAVDRHNDVNRKLGKPQWPGNDGE